MPDRVAKRKTHTKSRKGCIQCKQRHTKCNEDHPRCSNCIRLEIDCTWPLHPNGTSARTPRSESQDLEHGSLNSPGSIVTNTTILPLDDLRLLHHWHTKAAASMHKTLPTKRSQAWVGAVVELALDHPFLLHGILGLSAMHKAGSDSQADRTKVLVLADSHISTALGTYRKNLEEPSWETALPMFLLSSLLITYHMASAQLEEPEHPLDAIVHCFRLLKGVMVVISPHWEQLKGTELFSIMASEAMNPDYEPTTQDEDSKEVLKLRELVSSLGLADKDAYLQAINELNRTFIKARKCHEAGHVQSVMMVWPIAVNEQFFNLLSTHDPVAVIMLAHWTVPLTQYKVPWWINGWPLRIVSAAQRLLGNFPHLQSYLEWPLEHVKDGDEKG